MDNKILFLSIGTDAEEVLNFFYKKEKIDYLSIDNQSQTLNLSKRKTIWFNDNEYQKTQKDMEFHEKVLQTKFNILKDELMNYKHVIIVLYLGKEDVLNNLVEITKYLKSLKISHDIVGITPLFFKGGKDMDNHYINTTIKYLKSMGYMPGDNLYIYNCLKVYKEKKKNVIIKYSLQKYLLKNITDVLSLISDLRKQKE